MISSKAKKSIVLRDITKLSEMREVEELQRQVWGIDDLEVFPALALIPMREVGAVLIGAFDREQLIGFVFGFPGYENGRGILHSDMLAVKPEYRAHSLGYRLKLAQRERAIANGIDTITWTFDPLQAVNAHLNIAKLGAIADSYRVDYYGETTSFLHGAGTDRLWATWSLTSDRVRQRIEPGETLPAPNLGDTPSLISVGEGDEPITAETDLDKQPVVIEIPGNIDSLFKQSPALAIRWREATRQMFTKALDSGYIVAEFFRLERNGRSSARYLLISAAGK